MFMMSFQQNISFGGCNPFMMGCFNPRLNFFMGMAAATAVPPMPLFPAYNCSVFNPYMTMNYVNPFVTGGFGAYYPAPVFNYTPQIFMPQFTLPQLPVINTTAYSKSNTQTSVSTSASNSETRPQGMTLKGKGKGTQYGPEFLEKVKRIANNLNCNYRDLIAIMNSESSLNAQVVGYNGASGLICFMPQYFDTDKIRKMSPMEQLDLVEATIKKSKKAAGFADDAKLSKGDLYALVFLPARAGKEVLCREGETGKNGKLLRYYEANKALDFNHDGKITKNEMAARIDKKYVSDNTFLA